jgi:hypothetical protein
MPSNDTIVLFLIAAAFALIIIFIGGIALDL